MDFDLKFLKEITTDAGYSHWSNCWYACKENVWEFIYYFERDRAIIKLNKQHEINKQLKLL